MKWFGKKRTIEPGADEPRDKQEAEARRHPVFKVLQMLPGGDLLPGGYGPIGSITNPIPVNGLIGETIYLNQLRSPDDECYYYHRPGSTKTDISPNPIDGFELFSLDGKDRRTIWLSPYHPYRSTLAPEGCFIRAYPKDELLQVFIRTPGHGIWTRLASFPHDLPAALENSPQLAALGPGVGRPMADTAAKQLASLRLPERQRFVPGPINVCFQENESGQVVVLLDANRDLIEVCRIRHGATRSELDETLRQDNQAGTQSLLMYALLDEMNLTVEERRRFEGEVGFSSIDIPDFMMSFVALWLYHELQGRPRADGTYGPLVSTVRRTHWADLPILPVPLTRTAREILDALAERRG